MPFKRLGELPDDVKSLPLEAQRAYVMAYNMAWEQYKKLEPEKGEGVVEAMIKDIAWTAVKKAYSNYSVLLGGTNRKGP